MKKIDTHKLDKMRELLRTQEHWPSLYTFKFIVPVAKLSDILGLFPNEEKLESKPSAKGNYIAVTVKKVMNNADDVIKVYESVSVIEGVISL